MEIVCYNISWKKQDKKLKLYVQYDLNCVLKWAEKKTLKISIKKNKKNKKNKKKKIKISIAQYDQINHR